MDLKHSMDLAGYSLVNCLCPTAYHLPNFKVTIDKQYKAIIDFVAPDHNLGRWWDAMLRLEDVTGFVIPADTEAKMLDNLYTFFDNSDHICFIPLDLPGVPNQFYPHSFRENILALTALEYYRGSRWARRKADQMISVLSKILRDDCSWNFDLLDYHNKIVGQKGVEEIDYQEYRGRRSYIQDSNVGVDGRLIEGLAVSYSMTGNTRVFEFMNKLAQFHFKHSLNDDGSINTELFPTHTHSYLGTVKGLLLYGVLTNQTEYIKKVEATYANAIKKQIIKESGFASHDFLFDGMSETASAADVAQIALHLAMNGYHQYFDDVEKIVRSRLIPSQITEIQNIIPYFDDPNEDYKNLKQRVIGGYGCGMDHPNQANHIYTDVTASVLHGLIDIYRHIVLKKNNALMVCMHFNYEDDSVLITASRDTMGTVKIVPKTNENIMIRIPEWTDHDSVSVWVDGKAVRPTRIGGFLYISKDHGPREIVCKYSLPLRETNEKTMGTDFTYQWRGDEIISVYPNTDFLPFYPSVK